MNKKATWQEYEYRHKHIWSNVYKLTFSVSLLSVLPYLHQEVVCVLGHWVLWAPGLAIALSVFAILRGYRELKVLKTIRIKYREDQDTHNTLKDGWFTFHMLFYLLALLVASSVNAYVVHTKWVPVLHTDTRQCFTADEGAPNNSLQRTFESVTPFAFEKAAPLSQAAELRR